MRIYTSPDGRQLLADFRAEGFGQHIALGTLDRFEAGIRCAAKLRELRETGTAQLELADTSAGYRLRALLADFVEFGDHLSETMREVHRKQSAYLLRILGNPVVEGAPWWDLLAAARKKELKRGVKPQTLSKWESTLSRALDVAHARKRISVLPRLPRRQSSEYIPRKRWFTPEEMLAFVHAILNRPAQHQPELLRFARACRFLLRCWFGLSNRDANRIIVDAVNLVRATWHIPARGKTGVRGFEFPMPPAMLRVVRGWLDSPMGRLLRRTDPLLPRWPNERRGLCDVADFLRVESATPNDYRRTCAHLLRLAGYPREFAARWLLLSPGSPMLHDVYLQDDPVMTVDPARAAELDAVFGPEVTPSAPSAPVRALLIGLPRTTTELPISEARRRGRQKNEENQIGSEVKENVELSGSWVGPAGFEPAAYGLKGLAQTRQSATQFGNEGAPATAQLPKPREKRNGNETEEPTGE